MSLSEVKKRLLIIQPNIEAGGAQKMILSLSKYLKKSGWSVQIVVLFKQKKLSNILSYPSSTKIRYLNAQRFYSRLILPLKLVNIAKKSDLILAGMEDAATCYGYIASLLISKPFVSWIHTDILSHQKSTNFLNKIISKIIYCKIRNFVFPSKGTLNTMALILRSNSKITNFSVIPNFLLLDENLEHKVYLKMLLPKWFYTKKIILGIGRFVPEKAFERLLRAHAKLLNQGFDHHLVILGDGRERKRLESEVLNLNVKNSVYLPGHLEDVLPWLKQATALAVCSLYEGFSLVILEAMHAGLPVVSMDCPSGPRELLDDGRAGLLTPNGDEETFQAALAKILTKPDLRKHYAEQGRIRAALFTPERIVPRWESLFEKVISSHARRN